MPPRCTVVQAGERLGVSAGDKRQQPVIRQMLRFGILFLSSIGHSLPLALRFTGRRQARADHGKPGPQPRQAALFRHRLDRPQIEPRQFDSAGGSLRMKPQVVKKVAGKDRPVAEETGVEPLVGRVAVAERLQRRQAAVAALSDRGQEQALQHPRAVGVGQVGARHEDGVPAGRAGRQISARGEQSLAPYWIRPITRPSRRRACPTARTDPRPPASSARGRPAGCPGASATTCSSRTARARPTRSPRVRCSTAAHRIDGTTSSTRRDRQAGSRSIIDPRYPRTCRSTSPATAGMARPTPSPGAARGRPARRRR